jgi:predicted amidophosphoribosyltransferase
MHLHSFIERTDEIYFFYEYTVFEHTGGQGYMFSPGNDLIGNLKKDVVKYRDNAAVLRHKWRAVQTCADLISQNLNPDWLGGAVVVPVPPSKASDDPAYDDRMRRVATALQVRSQPPRPADTRDVIRQAVSLKKSHESAPGERPSIEELIAAYSIDEALIAPAPARFLILDDMLTTGRHFRAIHHMLKQRLPAAQVIGLFITRRVRPEGSET